MTEELYEQILRHCPLMYCAISKLGTSLAQNWLLFCRRSFVPTITCVLSRFYHMLFDLCFLTLLLFVLLSSPKTINTHVCWLLFVVFGFHLIRSDNKVIYMGFMNLIKIQSNKNIVFTNLYFSQYRYIYIYNCSLNFSKFKIFLRLLSLNYCFVWPTSWA